MKIFASLGQPLTSICLIFCLASNSQAQTSTFSFPNFGQVTAYNSSPNVTRVVIYVSGDGGWNLGVVSMAQEMARLNALVLGLSLPAYMKSLYQDKERCLYPAAHFKDLADYAEKKFNLPEYISPILVGYSSGATLVYTLLAQAPANTYAGAISLGFCSDLLMPGPLCSSKALKYEVLPKGHGLNFFPSKLIQNPWIALQGEIDQVCNPTATAKFISQTSNAKVYMLPKVGHGFSVDRNWLPQFKEAFLSFPEKKLQSNTAQQAEVAGLNDLPLVEVQPDPVPAPDLFSIIISGDGGWASIDKDLADALSDRGIPVVGLDSLRYLWKKKDAETVARDFKRILNHYAHTWNKHHVLVIGYSLGADLLPFMLAQLDEEEKKLVSRAVLLAPDPFVSFEFHLSDWLDGAPAADAMTVMPQIKKLKPLDLLCVYGDKETDSMCETMHPEWAKSIALPGSHHFGGRYRELAEIALKGLK